MKRLAAACLALLPGGCATELSSTLAVTVPAVNYVGLGTPTVPLAGVDAELVRLQNQLEQRLTGAEVAVPVQLTRGAEPFIRVRIAADESFEPGGAQLKAAALVAYAGLADVLLASPGTVAHVLGHGDVPESEPEADLGARRAASVLGYLAGRGVPATRLRAEGRGAREPATAETGAAAAPVNRRIDVVLQPVIEGREPEAWLPPRPAGCGACAAHE